MTTSHRLLAAALLLGGLSFVPSAQAAESYDNCSGFIDSLPATISTQGTWCLRQNLSTNIANGNAVTIAANNVTIDCNDFRIGGLAAGEGSIAAGIHAYGRQNVIVRRCGVRGFKWGITLHGAGHLVEDNRLDNNLSLGIMVSGDSGMVRNNRVYDTGGDPEETGVWGITGSASVIGNTIAGLYARNPGTQLYGIQNHSGHGGEIRDNSISGFDVAAASGSEAVGIHMAAYNRRVSGNHVSGSATSGNIEGVGLFATFPGRFLCVDNTVAGFTTNITNHCVSARNLTP